MWRRLCCLLVCVQSSDPNIAPSDSNSFSVREPWHLYQFPSLAYNFSLLDNAIVQSDSLCQHPPHLLSFDECLGLSYQSHRTLRQFYFSSVLEALFNVTTTLHFSLLMGFSYGLESCPSPSLSSVSFPPLDICFFGNIAPSVILLALLSCPAHRITVLNFDRLDLVAALTQLRLEFPNRSIKWIYGSYLSYFPPPAPPPHCNYLFIDEPSSHEFSYLLLPPIPSPVDLNHKQTSDNEEETLLSPCRGNGMIVQFQPYPSPWASGVSVLTEVYQRQGMTIDWRMETIVTDLTENASIRDYEGQQPPGSPLVSPQLTHTGRVPLSALSSPC
jgi:hypothetical protein